MYTYWLNCTNLGHSNCDFIWDMIDASEEITWSEFCVQCDDSLEDVLSELGYKLSSELRIEDDWGTRLYSSVINERPVLYINHSGTEYIFVKPEDADDLEQFINEENNTERES